MFGGCIEFGRIIRARRESREIVGASVGSRRRRITLLDAEQDVSKRQRVALLLVDSDEMKAERRKNGLGQLARTKLVGCLLELGYETPFGSATEVSTLRAGDGTARLAPGDGLEPCATRNLPTQPQKPSA